MFVDLPESGGSVSQGKSFGAVESVKATSDINSPISGEIVEVNPQLKDSPGLVIPNPKLFLSILWTLHLIGSILRYSCFILVHVLLSTVLNLVFVRLLLYNWIFNIGIRLLHS